jgi:hypothetical protein
MSAIRHRRHRSDPRATSRRPPWGPAAALRRDGALWSWGDNRNGQLGDGSMQNSPAPLDVMSLDGTPPTTVAGGVPSGWVRTKPVTVTLSATDAASGVREIAYDLGGSSWTTTPGAGPVCVPVTLEGATALSFRATDLAGNVESAQMATIRIDTVGTQATGVDLGYIYRCTLAKGKYTWRVYAGDLAGNAQTSIGATTLTVR